MLIVVILLILTLILEKIYFIKSKNKVKSNPIDAITVQKLYLDINTNNILDELDHIISEQINIYFILNINCVKDGTFINEENQIEISNYITSTIMKTYMTAYRTSMLRYCFNFSDHKELEDIISKRVALILMDKVIENNSYKGVVKDNSKSVDIGANF